MRVVRIVCFVWFFVLPTGGSTIAQTADTPYGVAKFTAYSDIDDIKQLKVVWDFNFTDPRGGEYRV
jgi:hypothetical protein